MGIRPLRGMLGRSRAHLRPTAVLALVACLASAALVAGGALGGPAASAPRTAAAAQAPGDVAGLARAGARPNVVVVMADDMRWDDLRFAPNIRRLFRAGGTEFRNSFANDPLCCPARASLLTGQLPHNHGVLSHNAPYGFGAFDDSRTIASTLRRSGYRTAFLGKYLNGYGRQRSLVSGRRSYRWVPPGWDQWYGAVEQPGPGYPAGGTYHYTKTVYNINGKPSGRRFHGEYQTETLGRFARGVAHRMSTGRRPWFMYLSFVAPHHGLPREPDDPRPQRLAGRQITYSTPARPPRVRGRFDATVRRAPGVPADGSQPDPSVEDLPGFLRSLPLNAHDRRALAEVTRQRAESIRVLDQQVGRLVEQLRRDRELGSTVLMFTSDNGYFLGEHNRRGGKILAHEPSLRIPFLIRGPGVPRGQQRWAPVSTVDQSATVLALGGAASRHPLALDGRSILPDLAGDRPWDEAVVDEGLLNLRHQDPDFADPRGSIGIRTARWSFMRYATGGSELYDLVADPDQLVNLAQDADHAVVRADLEEVWQRAAYCRGSGCRVTLPDSLAAEPAANRSATEQWYRTVRR